ncbi:class I SAM-dependent methyltransferase [Afifella sp. H1R]|uniref:class I SAM-dependent methyltransferase n=1 Tax=Afifella sp. H1R TaxID=2908841 RepID=UPI001F21BD13|nr:class I SAM-dependent methyltransferase [Afifella sp. H1R]MCF1504416.1 class I SAM-dependent methyltransferase [Afifella sp. H1R]
MAETRGEACPVCRGGDVGLFLTVDGKNYWRCATCAARYLDPAQRPSPAEERAHYLTHENDPDDPGYRRWLSRLTRPLLERLSPGANGLDYGCGPGPALAKIFAEAGHHMAVYDPIFAPDPAPLDDRYDVVTCTETAEHFHDPTGEFDRLAGLLKPGGLLGVMTIFQTDDARFANWRYRRDPTHVVFYRAETFRLIASRRGLTCEIVEKDVVLMQKGG